MLSELNYFQLDMSLNAMKPEICKQGKFSWNCLCNSGKTKWI